MSGILGTFDLKGGVTQSICVGDTDQFTTANISICNRHNVAVKIKLALTSAANTFEAAKFIEYDTVLLPKGVLERSAVIVPSNTYVTIWSDYSNVSAVAYGIRAGDPISVSAIPVAVDSTNPILDVTSFTFNELGKEYIEQLTASNEEGAVVFGTTDTLPSGFTLNSSGEIRGTIQTGTASATVNITCTDQSGNTSTTAVDFVIPDGSSSALAAPSAQFIKTTTGTNTDGTYWIDLPTSGPTETYCVMDSNADGGGWMLAMKATRGSTFEYSSNYWTTTNLLNETDLTLGDADAKYPVFNEFAANDIAANLPDVTAGGSLGALGGGWTMHDNDVFNGLTPQVFFNSDSQVTIRTQGDVDSWGGLGKNNSGPFSTQNGYRWQGLNYGENSGNRVRYGFAWNNENDPFSNDVSGGIGMNRQAYSAGDYIGCCQDYNGVQRSMRFELYVR